MLGSERVEEPAPGRGTHAKPSIAALHASGATSGSGPGGGSLPGPTRHEMLGVVQLSGRWREAMEIAFSGRRTLCR
jgi:hypothetical protein